MRHDLYDTRRSEVILGLFAGLSWKQRKGSEPAVSLPVQPKLLGRVERGLAVKKNVKLYDQTTQPQM